MARNKRKPGFAVDETHRQRIQSAMLIKRLSDFVEGKVIMEAPQVTAALGLLKKVMPDLSQSQISGDEEAPLIHRVERVIVDNTQD